MTFYDVLHDFLKFSLLFFLEFQSRSYALCTAVAQTFMLKMLFSSFRLNLGHTLLNNARLQMKMAEKLHGVCLQYRERGENYAELTNHWGYLMVFLWVLR